MNTFLGLIVLTGPLFLIVLWVPVCIALAVWVGRKFIKKALPLKIAGGAAVFLIILVIPIADEIAGRIYFNHLCETKAGVKVYQTIELPAEYWNEDGKPKFYVNWDTGLGKKYPLIYTKGAIASLFHVGNAGYKFVDRQSDEVLGEVVNFRYGGGWLLRNFNPPNTSNSCELKEEIINDIFIPENKTKGTNHGNNQ
jgi:hypothetical protein